MCSGGTEKTVGVVPDMDGSWKTAERCSVSEAERRWIGFDFPLVCCADGQMKNSAFI